MDSKNLIKDADLKTAIVHSLVFLLPFLTLITKSGVGLCSFGFLLLAMWYHRQGLPPLQRHFSDVRGVLGAFLFAFLFTAAVVALDDEFILRYLEKPARMLFAAAAMVVVLALRPSRKALWWGLVAGAVAGASVAVYQRLILHVDRPGGGINAITFGDIVLCLGLMSLAGVLDFPRRQRIWPALGAVAGVVGMLATGTRGGWAAILLAVLVFVKYGNHLRSKFARAATALVAALTVGAFFVPQVGVLERLEQGVDDVRNYYFGDQAFTNVGVRLEMWKAGLLLIERHPVTPTSYADVKAELGELVAQGKVRPFVLDFEHFHNDALQAQVIGGVGGLLAWLLSLLLPFLFFRRVLNRHGARGGPPVALALAGMLLVVSYFSFGLTEVIFWSVRSCMFYALMLFILVGMCLNAEQQAGEGR